MAVEQNVITELCARFERDTGINLHDSPIQISGVGEGLQLEGEMDNIAMKRLAVRIAGELVGPEAVDDRLTVKPTEPREDGAIRDGIQNAFQEEPVFRETNLYVWNKGHWETLRQVDGRADGRIEISVENGTVTLAGEVWSLSHKRMASLLAWWIRGARNVVNLIKVVPEEQDTDQEITDAVRLALDKDPMVHSDQIRVTTRSGNVMLEGLVPQDVEKKAAEYDVWYLTGVSGVTNKIQVGR
jgi:osmotically-inducible protein OsmY